MKVIYCTILNTRFVPRAVALQRSIQCHSPAATFGYYCVDDATVAQLKTLAPTNSRIVTPHEFESDPLRFRKEAVKLNEYCWTCKPAILQHALLADASLDWGVWLDADMFVFGDLDSALTDLLDANVALTPHRFSSPEFKSLEPIVGRFNAGFAAFRNTNEGHRALTWWSQRCLEGCPAVPIDGKYADQRYLDEIPKRFSKVAEISHEGINAAPWNILDKTIELRNSQVYVSGQPLLLYHFQGLKVIRSWIFDLYAAARALPRQVRHLIYRPYTNALATAMRDVANQTHNSNIGLDSYVTSFGGLLRTARHFVSSRNIHIQPILK